jgi:hypothetical protein
VSARWLGLYILAADGSSPVPVPDAEYDRWAAWFWDIGNRRVALTQVGPFVVSTIFLGIDISGDQPPTLWETMVEGSDAWGRQIRYPSRAEAEDGHAAIVELVRAGRIGVDVVGD